MKAILLLAMMSFVFSGGSTGKEVSKTGKEVSTGKKVSKTGKEVIHCNIDNYKEYVFKNDKKNTVTCDVRYADLRYADLQKADLYKADLQEANLRKANLRYADLRGAKLKEAKLRKAVLKDAKVTPEQAKYLKSRGISGFTVQSYY